MPFESEEKFLNHPNVTAYGHRLDGWYYCFEFPNGFGASVVIFSGTYGSYMNLYEMVGMINGETDYTILEHKCDDPLGWLTVDNVLEELNKIAELPMRHDSVKHAPEDSLAPVFVTEEEERKANDFSPCLGSGPALAELGGF